MASTTTTSVAPRTTVKLSLADETHRVSLEALSLEALCALVPRTFGAAAPRAFALVYVDPEGDVVTVSSAAELDEARRVLGAGARPLHLRVVPKVGVLEQLPPAVLQAVDELSSTIARLASDTRESLAQSAYLERGRAGVASSARRTGELLDAARREVAQRLRDVHARIAGEIERRRSSAGSAADAAFVAPVASPVAVVSTASGAVGAAITTTTTISSNDSDDVVMTNDDNDEAASVETPSEDVASVAVSTTTTAAPVTIATAADAATLEGGEQQALETRNAPVVAPEEEQPRAADAPYESDAETVASSDNDDDDDHDDLGGDCDSDDGWDVVPAAWSSDVALVRSILPHVAAEDCVAMLRKHGGDLEAAINELTE